MNSISVGPPLQTKDQQQQHLEEQIHLWLVVAALIKFSLVIHHQNVVKLLCHQLRFIHLLRSVKQVPSYVSWSS